MFTVRNLRLDIKSLEVLDEKGEIHVFTWGGAPEEGRATCPIPHQIKVDKKQLTLLQSSPVFQHWTTIQPDSEKPEMEWYSQSSAS